MTTFLENLIHEGRAAFRVFNGIAGVMRLQIPEKNYIVITDVYIENHVEPHINQAKNFKLWVRSEGNFGFALLHRSRSINVDNTFVDKQQHSYGRNHWALYSIQSGLLKISLGSIDNIVNWVVADFSQAPAISEEENTTQGYGINPVGSNTLRNVRVNIPGGVQFYNPLTEEISPTGAGVKTSIEQFVPGVFPLFDPFDPAINDTYPMVTMCYVQVFEELKPNIKK